MPPRQVFQSGENAHVFLGIIDGNSPNRTSQLEAFRESVNGNDTGRAQHESAGDCELSDGTAAPDGDGVILLDLGILGSHVPRGEDIGKEQHFFIRKIAFDLQRSDIRKRHPHILRLAARISTHHVGIPEQARTGISIGGFHQVGIRIGIIAGGPDLLLTKLAIPACDGEGHHYAIAPLQDS